MADKVAFELSWSAAINEASFYSRPLARFIGRIRVQLIALAVVGGIGIVGAVGLFVERQTRERSLQERRFESIKDWALSNRAGTENEIEQMFRLASNLKVDEAVTKAVVYAIRPDRNPDKTRRYHVLAARDFLAAYSMDEIERLVRKDGVQFTNPDAVISQLREVLIQ